MDAKQSMKGWWIGPALAFTFALGLVGSASAGYWVRDDRADKPQFQSQPECPRGMVPGKLVGVMYNAGAWNPIYSCDFDNGQSLQKVDSTQLNTTSPSPTVTRLP